MTGFCAALQVGAPPCGCRSARMSITTESPGTHATSMLGVARFKKAIGPWSWCSSPGWD